MVLTKTVEVCCADTMSVMAAEKAGAPRIELCSALPLGGVTPSSGIVSVARSLFSGRIHVLIRPREGDFVYSDSEKEAMLRDIAHMAEAGCEGVVAGALNADGSVDYDFAARIAREARRNKLSLTFHRAFDVCSDRSEALETLVSLGYDRILTSGGADNALDGADELARLNRQAAGRIIILPGGGVTTRNAGDIIKATGATEIHGSCRAGGSDSSDANVISTIMHIINYE